MADDERQYRMYAGQMAGQAGFVVVVDLNRFDAWWEVELGGSATEHNYLMRFLGYQAV